MRYVQPTIREGSAIESITPSGWISPRRSRGRNLPVRTSSPRMPALLGAADVPADIVADHEGLGGLGTKAASAAAKKGLAGLPRTTGAMPVAR